MEVCLALGVIDSSPFLAPEIRVIALALVLVPYSVSDTSSIGLRLVAECAVISKFRRAILPAHRADSVKSSSAERIAKGSVFLLTFSASSDDLSHTSSVSILPAGRSKSNRCEQKQ